MDVVEKELDELDTAIGDLSGKLKESTAPINQLREQYQQLPAWSDIFEGGNIVVQKIMAGNLIKRVLVSRGYEVQVEFNIDESRYRSGLGQAM